MEKNIFEGAKFGDKFLTRDGRIAIFYDFSPDKKVCRLLYKGEGLMEIYTDDGSFYHNLRVDNFDIVSRYKEPINEEKLDELAEEYAEQFYIDDKEYQYACKKDFKAGYKKAKGE